MFKLKAGNVIEKLNKMDRKQAYTYGGIGVGVLVALFLLASFMGNADETSFDDFTARGYDLADSPFATDEAEEFLLASAYPDMKNNNAYTLYGPAERAKREAEDAQAAQESEEQDENDESSATSSDEEAEGYSYSGRNRYGNRGGRSGPTQVQQLSGANVSHSNGAEMGSSWGSPRLDTTAFRQNDRAKDTINTSKGGMNAKRALSQFASASQAGAKLKEGKAVNMKRSLMGGDIVGANTNADGTVDLSNVDAAHLDTEAPDASSPDYDNLKDQLTQAADKAKEKEDENNEKTEKSFLEGLLDSLVKEAISGLGKMISGQFQAWGDDIKDTRDLNRQAKNMYNESPMSQQTRDWLKAQYPNEWSENRCSGAMPTSVCWNALTNRGEYDKKGFQKAYRTGQRGSKRK